MASQQGKRTSSQSEEGTDAPSQPEAKRVFKLKPIPRHKVPWKTHRPNVHRCEYARYGKENSFICWKRLSLSEQVIMCNCGLRFCQLHKYPEQHDCDCDYKAEARERLAEEMPKIEDDHGLKKM
eukprot:scpid108902/ scgid6565/ Zinc finger A20 and AN1 domain-containing stress-associated protein 4